MPDWWICQVSSGHELNLGWARPAIRRVALRGVRGQAGVNGPGHCRVEVIGLTVYRTDRAPVGFGLAVVIRGIENFPRKWGTAVGLLGRWAGAPG